MPYWHIRGSRFARLVWLIRRSPRRHAPSVFGVLFDGFAYGMLLFLLSVGLSVTLGMMNFVNLAHCTFAMLGGYVTVTLMNRYGWPFFATLPVAFLVGRAGQRRVRARALPAALSRERSRSGAADDRARVHRRWRSRPTSSAPSSSRCRLPSYLRGSIDLLGRQSRRSTGCSWSASRSPSRSLLVGDARIHALRRAGARRGRQPAHGARPRHQCRPHLRHHLRARQRTRRTRRRAGDRDRRPRSALSHSPIWFTC